MSTFHTDRADGTKSVICVYPSGYTRAAPRSATVQEGSILPYPSDFVILGTSAKLRATWPHDFPSSVASAL